MGLEGSSQLFASREKMIDLNKYCSQPDQVKARIDEKKSMTFHLDNAQLYVSLVIKQNVIQPSSIVT